MGLFPHPQAAFPGLQIPTTLNPSYKSGNVTLSNGNLSAAATATTWSNVAAIFTATTGKFYAEFTMVGADTGRELGLFIGSPSVTTEISGQSGGLTVGVQTSNGGDVWVAGTRPAQYSVPANSIQPSGGGAPTAGDRWDIALDLVNNRFFVRTTRNPNPAYWNNDSAVSPTAPSTGVDISSWRGSNAVGMILGLQNSPAGWTANFGQSPMLGAVPTGFLLGFGT